jgi:hypothetical protein
MRAETLADLALARSLLMALRACDCTSRADRVATTKATVSATLRASCVEDEWEVSSAAKVSRKSDRSCVVQRERGADPAPIGAELVPSKVASDCCSVSDSEQLVLASSVA